MVLNPITPLGSVVVNAAYDICHFARASRQDGDVSNHRIEKKDLVFTDLTQSKRRRSNYNEPDLKVFATTNGVKAEFLKRSSYGFVGISNAHIEADSQRNTAVTIAGLVTIKNTGTQKIEAGDKIVWDIADHSLNCPNPKKRKVFRTVAYHKQFGGEANTFIEEVGCALENENTQGLSKDALSIASLFKEALQGEVDEGNMGRVFEKQSMFLRSLMKAVSDTNSRVIGTALSKAEGDQDFDILLRHSH
jgi:hypothetical protein